jgi:hypothetical protein
MQKNQSLITIPRSGMLCTGGIFTQKLLLLETAKHSCKSSPTLTEK